MRPCFKTIEKHRASFYGCSNYPKCKFHTKTLDK
ncbi:MAG: topoisomerase DNA-binding C4 zinc finger domain-containing protein [Bacilli bacterium]|nr:topoisomerase DNA-binding C4 zinc finger domain-containing protein [Bacilli bacterium]